jgi:hypothetical protein
LLWEDLCISCGPSARKGLRLGPAPGMLRARRRWVKGRDSRRAVGLEVFEFQAGGRVGGPKLVAPWWFFRLDGASPQIGLERVHGSIRNRELQLHLTRGLIVRSLEPLVLSVRHEAGNAGLRHADERSHDQNQMQIAEMIFRSPRNATGNPRPPEYEKEDLNGTVHVREAAWSQRLRLGPAADAGGGKGRRQADHYCRQPRQAAQRQRLPLMYSRISPSDPAWPSLIQAIADRIWPGVQ